MQLEEFLERSAHRLPDKTALVCGQQRLTYAEIERDSNRLAHALSARGVSRGDRVIICLENTPEAAIAIFAVLKVGGVFVMANPTTKADKLCYLLTDSGAASLIISGRKLRTLALESYWKDLPELTSILTVGRGLPEGLDFGRPQADLHQVLKDCQEQTSCPRKQAIDIDLAALVYTSGSTGNPKGVMLTHRNMVAAATSITAYLKSCEDDVVLNVLPLSFDYGLYQLLMTFRVGGTLLLEKSFTYPHAVLKQLVDERVTGFPLVPTVSAILLQMDLTKYDFSHLRYLTNTGAAFPTEHIRRLRELLPHVRIYSMYGLTECKRVSYMPPEELDRRITSVGRAMPNTEVYIEDDAGGRVGPGVVGELIVRGANVMQGYWNAPELTAEKLKPGPLPGERVLRTGDLFRMDEDGYLYFVGRRDDIIKSRGEKVSPREVENVLFSHPAIAEAAVVGEVDPILGEAIRAAIALKEGATLTERDVLAYCRKHLEDFMVPQVIEFHERLPKSANGKIDKKQLCGAMTC